MINVPYVWKIILLIIVRASIEVSTLCKFPVHKTLNNNFHFICYLCFLKLNSIFCPLCREINHFIINKYAILDIYNACCNNNHKLAIKYCIKNK